MLASSLALGGFTALYLVPILPGADSVPSCVGVVKKGVGGKTWLILPAALDWQWLAGRERSDTQGIQIADSIWRPSSHLERTLPRVFVDPFTF